MQSIKFVIFCALISCAFAQTPTSECPEGLHPTEVLISDELGECTSSPCRVHPGKTIVLKMKFASPKYLDNIAPRVLAMIGDGVPFPLGQKDACDGITNTPCPIAKNEQVEYALSIPLWSIIPKIDLSLKFSIVETITTNINGENAADKVAKEKAVVCLLVNLRVEPAE